MVSPRERYEQGKRLRAACPRGSQGDWPLIESPRRRLALLDRANAGRVVALLPEKRTRMLASPFAFFRGSAPLMAAP